MLSIPRVDIFLRPPFSGMDVHVRALFAQTTVTKEV
jgi:hypothetical protein